MLAGNARLLPCRLVLPLALAFALGSPRPVHADHSPFAEDFDNEPCCLLSDDAEIVRELPLFINVYFARSGLSNFLDDPLLPVENGDEDYELLWDNTGIGAGESLALNAEGHGLYNELEMTMETDLAMWSVDPPLAEMRGGVVVRQMPTPFQFYCAYARVTEEDGLKIRLHLEKWVGDHFEDLDASAGVGAPFPFEIRKNYHVKLFVSAPVFPGASSELAASLDELNVVDGVVVATRLTDLVGRDNDIRQGYVGMYAGGATLATQVAFDNGYCAVAGATPARQATWGAIKGRYRGR
ncbi:MAG: hypothetical protein ACRENJ_08815 [Candidatus Eiseniibacteriota bacterium]